jgi:hypothetical protein
VVDLQVEQAGLQLLEAPFVIDVVERSVDHLDLVQRRPLAHLFLRNPWCHRRLTAASAVTTNRVDG